MTQDPAAPSDAAAPSAGRHRRDKASGHGSFLKELPFLVVIALGLALLIKTFVVQAFYIPSGSMQQTLELQDRVLVNKLSYRFGEIQRGDIVVFNGLDNFDPEPNRIVEAPANGLQKALRGVARALGVGPPTNRDFIKRVIGVAGDRVACCTNGHVTVQPKGSPTAVELQEDYLYVDDRAEFCEAGTGPQSCPAGAPGVLVPEGRLWVLGDHRSASSDSRAHITDKNNGTVPTDKVIGKAFVVVWPLERFGGLGRPATFDQPALDGASALPPLTGPGAAGAPLGLALALPLPLVARRLRRR